MLLHEQLSQNGRSRLYAFRCAVRSVCVWCLDRGQWPLVVSVWAGVYLFFIAAWWCAIWYMQERLYVDLNKRGFAAMGAVLGACVFGPARITCQILSKRLLAYYEIRRFRQATFGRRMEELQGFRISHHPVLCRSERTVSSKNIAENQKNVLYSPAAFLVTALLMLALPAAWYLVSRSSMAGAVLLFFLLLFLFRAVTRFFL